jgi:hypothetical protein
VAQQNRLPSPEAMAPVRMAQEPADQGGGVFIVKQVVFIVGAISVMARRILRKRLGSELDAVCARSHRKAELFRGADAG